ncbi:Lrp/AsnC family transcriptional regulator [Desulfobulbus sp.]|uniref:Lrp/AsnC family transcriptional regulator n=1 Tax=Desulfobulbus sp. TaxID=895 RepID=UPI0027B8ECEF|nr:Lrp/AsnC family transcriptional regulator [Desulfobulbus sp.]
MNSKNQINVRLNPNQIRLLLHLVGFRKKIINTTYNDIARALGITKKAARERVEALEREHLISKSVAYLRQSDKPTGIQIRVFDLAIAFLRTDRKEKELNESLRNYVLSIESFSMEDWIEIRLMAIHGSTKIVKKKINANHYKEESLTIRELNKIKSKIEKFISDQKTRNHFRKNFNITPLYNQLGIKNAMIEGVFNDNIKKNDTERGVNRKFFKKFETCLDLLMEEPSDKKNWIVLATIFEEMSMDDLVVHMLKILNSLENNYLISAFHDRFESIVGKMPELSVPLSRM